MEDQERPVHVSISRAKDLDTEVQTSSAIVAYIEPDRLPGVVGVRIEGSTASVEEEVALTAGIIMRAMERGTLGPAILTARAGPATKVKDGKAEIPLPGKMFEGEARSPWTYGGDAPQL